MRNLFFSICTWLLVASGVCLAVFGGMDYWKSRHGQSVVEEEWNRQERNTANSAEKEVPIDAARTSASNLGVSRSGKRFSRPHAGEAVAKLLIPRLDASLFVVEGTDDRDLQRGPGHMTGTVLPGEDGNCIIAGHRDTHFSVLKNIRSGDEIIVQRHGESFHYRVDDLSVVTPDNTDSLRPTNKPVLNLITCFPFQYVGSAPKRFIVHAALESSPLQASRQVLQ